MRIEYAFALDEVDVPTFSVDVMEGPQKLFQLATLILNILSEKPRVEVIFHSPNEADLPKKVRSFEAILASAPTTPAFELKPGNAGSLGSSYYTWVSIQAS